MSGRIHFMRNKGDTDFTGTSVAIGVFDGVHLGHRFLIDQTRKAAERFSGRSAVVTFSIDPDELFSSGAHMKLMTNSERIFALAMSGVDEVAVLPFDYEFAEMDPAAFLEWAFGSNYPDSIHVGSGFRFGRRGSGTVKDLKVWGARHGVDICVHHLLRIRGRAVSSTRIRKLMRSNREDEAHSLLGIAG